MKCLDCGSTWRILGAVKQAPVQSEVRQVPLVHVSETRMSDSIEDIGKTVGKNKPGLGVLMASLAIILLFAGLYLGVHLVQEDQQIVRSDKLHISEVEMEELVRQNGSKVFTVKSHTQGVPTLFISHKAGV